jgi:hypothetical protein
VIFDHAGDIYAANGFWLLAEKYWRGALIAGAKEGTKIQEKLRKLPGGSQAGEGVPSARPPSPQS